MSAAERGQKVIERYLVRQVDDREAESDRDVLYFEETIFASGNVATSATEAVNETLPRAR